MKFHPKSCRPINQATRQTSLADQATRQTSRALFDAIRRLCCGLGFVWIVLISQSSCSRETGPVSHAPPLSEPASTEVVPARMTGDIGECFMADGKISDALSGVKASCSEAHTHEIYARMILDAGPYPGRETMIDKATQFCEQQLPIQIAPEVLAATAKRAQETELSSFQPIFPSPESWQENNDLSIYCLYVEFAQPGVSTLANRTESALAKPDSAVILKAHDREVTYNINMGCFASMSVISAMSESAGEKALAAKFESEAEKRLRSMIEGGTARLEDDNQIIAEAEEHGRFVTKLESFNERQILEKVEACAPHLLEELKAPAE
jgi:hypothetical protein